MIIEGLSLIQTTYSNYLDLLQGNLDAIEEFWPDHPSIEMADGIDRLREQLLTALQNTRERFVVILASDYRVCAPVKQEKLAECVSFMRAHPNVLSCSLTWEPVSKSTYFGFDLLPPNHPRWPYAVNFQARVWNVDNFIRLLSDVDEDYNEGAIEQTCNAVFGKWPNPLAVSYPIPAPPNPMSFVDRNDKSEWIIPYNNLMHNGKPFHKF